MDAVRPAGRARLTPSLAHLLGAGRTALRESVLAGLAGGLAMIPVGLVARGLGASVNVYGELVVQQLLGRLEPIALLVEHLLVSWAMAVPLVAVLRLARHRHAAAIGLTYGAAAWLSVNALALPIVFGRPMPWTIGWSAVWGSWLVHLAFGLAAALVGRRLARRRVADDDMVHGRTAGVLVEH